MYRIKKKSVVIGVALIVILAVTSIVSVGMAIKTSYQLETERVRAEKLQDDRDELINKNKDYQKHIVDLEMRLGNYCE